MYGSVRVVEDTIECTQQGMKGVESVLTKKIHGLQKASKKYKYYFHTKVLQYEYNKR